MPRLSVLIPCLGDTRAFENTLASVLQNRPDDCEVLVAHSREYRDPYRLTGEVCFLHVPQARNVVSLLNAGFEAARSGLIHVLQCGLEVDDGWTDGPLARFDDEKVASVSPVIVDAKTRDRVFSAGLTYSRHGRSQAAGAGRKLSLLQHSKLDVVGPTLAAGFYRRSWWRLVRWDEATGDDFADAQFNLSLRRLGATAVLEPLCLIRAESPLGLAAHEPYGFVAARRAEQLFWRQSQQSPSVAQIAWRTALFLSEALLAIPSPRAVTGLAGRIVGTFCLNDRQMYQKRMSETVERLEAEKIEAGQAATLPFSTIQRLRTPARQKRAA